MRRPPRRRATAVALATALALALPTPALAAVAEAAGGAAGEEDAFALLERARQARSLLFIGEAVWMSWEGGVERSTLIEVRGGEGWLRLDADDGLGALALPGAAEGRMLRLPVATGGTGERALEAKYGAAVVGGDRLLDRPCKVLELRAHEEVLRERLCLDEATGFVLRREVYDDDGRRVRMVGWTELRLTPELARAAARERVSRTRTEVGRSPGQILSVDTVGLEALREADWTVPDVLPGGYAPVAAYAVSAPDAAPLQVVYDDGLYQVSLFQQRGRLDRDGLPAGAEPAAVGFPAWEWPGALPRRIVWEADGATYTLVGDAPPAEFDAIARALPHPDELGPVERMRRGFGALWRRVSRWR